MEKKTIFRGVGTAMITPYKNGRIDYKCLSGLIERQIEFGIDAIIIGGTTGEAATLENRERYELFEKSAKMIDGRAKLIFGTGTNDTRLAEEHTKRASGIGCDGVLLVTPYYNKGTKEGLKRHYRRIADSSSVPVLLYNVPSRTGVNLDLDTVRELCRHPRIVGIKEASDSADRLSSLGSLTKELDLYAGNDSQIYTSLCLGAMGVISVVSNLYPKETEEICKLYFANMAEKSYEKQKELMPVIESLFLETNPAPLKYAMAKLGLCTSEMRLPMWLPTVKTRRRIDKIISEYESGAKK